MNYRTEKNDRTRRRKAGAITAFITISFLVGFAYVFGLLDEVPFLNDSPEVKMVDAVARA